MPYCYLRARWPRAALLLAIAAAPLAAQDRPAERAFAEQALPEIVVAFPDAEVSVEPGDPLQINIKRATEAESGAINLHRLFNFCKTITPEECAAERSRLVNIFAEASTRAAPTAANLRIIVRDAQYWDYVERTLGKRGTLPIHRKIGDDLYAILAIDSPEAIQAADGAVVTDLGLSEAEAWAQAADQTEAIIPGLPEDQVIGDSLFAFQGEEYTGTMLAFPDRWTALAAANGPDLAVIVNSDQMVAAAVIPDGAELDRFRQLAQEQCDVAPRCTSPNVYRWRDGRWVIAR